MLLVPPALMAYPAGPATKLSLTYIPAPGAKSGLGLRRARWHDNEFGGSHDYSEA